MSKLATPSVSVDWIPREKVASRLVVSLAELPLPLAETPE